MRPLTPKQQRFAEEYCVDFNATQAAIRAGYSKKVAEVTGSKLVRNAKVGAAILAKTQRHAAKLEITVERVLKELAIIGFAQSGDYFEWGPSGVKLIDKKQLTEDQMRAVSEVSETVTKDGGSIRLKLHDKVSALVKVGQYLGMFVEKHEHTGKDGGPIELADMTQDEMVKQISLMFAQAAEKLNSVHPNARTDTQALGGDGQGPAD